jgi:hypothetical protein
MFVSRSVGNLTMAVGSLALAGLAGCATNTRANLTNAAENLEYNANALVRDAGAEVARTDDMTPRGDETAAYATEYARDARVLARDAHELRVVVDEGGTATAVHTAFDRVSRSSHAVRDEGRPLGQPAGPRGSGLGNRLLPCHPARWVYSPGNDEYLPPA